MSSVSVPPRHARPTLEDVARLAGVSRATASRAVNRDPAVSELTAAAVQRAVTQLGYRPNRAARALVTQRVGAVAMLVTETDERVFSDPFFPQAYHGALSAFARTDWQVILTMDPPGGAGSRMVGYLNSGHVDGALVVSHHGPELARALEATGVPTVFIGDPEIPGALFVDVDQIAGARLAVEHLLARGARRLGVISGPLDMVAGVRRLAGYRAAVLEAGLPDDAVAIGDFTMRSGSEAADALLDSHPDLDGLFIASDLMALGALRALRRRGRRVPADVRVVSFDNSSGALQAEPRLTSMSNPAQEMGRLAGELLLARLREEPVRSPLILGSELVVRESS